MKITPFQQVLGVVLSLGFVYLACDYRGFREEPVQALHGHIRLEGRPLPKGMIRFISTETQQIKGAGGYIVDGDYVVPEEFGLPPGKYQVQVSSIRSDEIVKALATRSDDDMKIELKETVPARYNIESEIFIDLTEQGVLGVDLDLK